MTSSPSTAFSRLAPLFLLLCVGCGDDGGGSVADDGPAAPSLVDVLAGGELTPELRTELSGLVRASTERLVELAGRVGEGELTPTEADSLYGDWLAAEAVERSLTADQLGRLLTGAVGGRYR